MTKDELVEIVDVVRANWNMLELSPQKERAMYSTWWRYLRNFDHQEVFAVIDTLIRLDGYRPRIGQVYRMTIDRRTDDAPPSELQAIIEAQALIDASGQGFTSEITPHKYVIDAMNNLRSRVGDRFTEKAFSEEYRKILEKHYAEDTIETE